MNFHKNEPKEGRLKETRMILATNSQRGTLLSFSSWHTAESHNHYPSTGDISM